MNTIIKLRSAIINDLQTLKHWDQQTHVIESDPNDDWDWETELNIKHNWREQLIAELNGKPIGFIQIINPAEEDTHYWGEVSQNCRAIDIWIGDHENLGKGFGTIMMNLTIERCFSDEDVTEIIIDPLETNILAHRFYEKLGFKFVEVRKFGNDSCRIYQLTREAWIIKLQKSI